jgi:hypothetical protein
MRNLGLSFSISGFNFFEAAWVIILYLTLNQLERLKRAF